MVLPGSCHAAFTVLRQIESVVVLEQLGSSLFDTALQMVVKDRSVNATYTDVSEEDSQQKFMTDFFLIYNLIIGLTPILPAMLLARLGDRGWRRAPIMLPLSGYLLSRLALLLVVLFRLPLEVMYGAGVVFGLSGGFCAYWPGVMTLASLGSTAKDRSKVLMRVELLYGGGRPGGQPGVGAPLPALQLQHPTRVHPALREHSAAPALPLTLHHPAAGEASPHPRARGRQRPPAPGPRGESLWKPL
ncbi:hypothetical protein CesoFtcFv8_024081 [Champsocephalus esox]|uniref:Uncharacterized protein n=1 Tax=Champsocephalus esox TaxID=159716 RepID=A0AAN8GI28_9TELE|nr:hypothetical protein CesoFtcFv8_024081 [Champsocephalus esox]